MWPYHPDLLARPVPRYTSYPTAAEFTPDLGEAELAQALDAVEAEQPLSLYVHIPFCQEICWYCGCNTGRANRTQRLSSYLDALSAEIHLIANRLGGRGKVGRIAFGGGSPNALSPVAFARLVDELIVAFGCTSAPTLSIEIDPRSFGAGWDVTLAATRASRVSLGVQTFDPAIQAAIGRVQPETLIIDTVARLRRSGVSSINFDLIYGLPDQTRESLMDTLERTVALMPERIALFGYAHVPHLLPRQRRIQADNLPGQAERFAMAAMGHERLAAAGYMPVGFDHFALPGDALAIAARTGQLRRNFQGFTEDDSSVLIGLGASSISQFPDRLIQNEKNSGTYRALCMGHRLPGARGVMRDAEDRMRALIIEDLLCMGSADISELGDLDAQAGPLAPFLAHGLATLSDGLLTIPPAGLPYARSIAALFDRYRAVAPQRFSSAI